MAILRPRSRRQIGHSEIAFDGSLEICLFNFGKLCIVHLPYMVPKGTGEILQCLQNLGFLKSKKI